MRSSVTETTKRFSFFMEVKTLGFVPRALGRILKIRRGRFLIITFVFLILLGLINRASSLGSRPLHHDESIHSTFSLDWYENPEVKYYKYDPVYHGPVLYSLVAVAYQIMGPGVWSARSIALLFGVLLIFSPIFFWRQLGIYGTAAAMCLVAISPLLNFYSRFVIHDGLCLFLIAVSAVSGTRLFTSARKIKVGKDSRFKIGLIFGTSTGILTAAKLVGVIHIVFLAFFILLNFLAKTKKKRAEFVDSIKGTRIIEAILVSGALSFALFISSLGSNLSVFTGGFLSKTFEHWWSQHQGQRLVGPTIFHLRSMLLHELFMCVVVLFAGIYELIKLDRGKSTIKWLSFILLVSLLAYHFNFRVKDVFPLFHPLLSSVKIIEFCDVFTYALCLVCGIYLPLQFLVHRKTGLAFLWYWPFANLAAFSFIGEKVPWLTLYVCYPTVLLAGFYLGRFLSHWMRMEKLGWNGRFLFRTFALSFSLIFTAATSYVVCHVTEGKKVDLLSQVHNSNYVGVVWNQLRKIASQQPKGRIKVAMSGEPIWSFYFYVRTENFVDLALDVKVPDSTYDAMIFAKDNFTEEDQNKARSLGFSLTNYELTWWFVPEFVEMSLMRWIQYAFKRNVMEGTGFREMTVAIHERNLSFLQEVPQ